MFLKNTPFSKGFHIFGLYCYIGRNPNYDKGERQMIIEREHQQKKKCLFMLSTSFYHQPPLLNIIINEFDVRIYS